MSSNLLTLADTLMVGSLGTVELAAVGYGLMVIFTLYAFFLGFFSTFTTFAAQFHGADQVERGRSLLTLAVWFGTGAGLLILAAGLASGKVLPLMGLDPHLADMVYLYVSRRAFGAPFFFIGIAFSSILTGLGDTRTPMKITLLVNGINVALNYLLIFGHAGLPALGIAGAGLATALANGITLVIYLGILRRVLPAGMRAWRLFHRPDHRLVRDLARIGSPAGLYTAMDIGSLLAFSTIVERISIDALAVNQVAMRVMTLSFMVNMGFSIATTTMVGQAAGRREPFGVRQASRRTLHLGILALILLSTVYIALRYPIVHAFSLSGPLVAQGVQMVWLMSLFHVFDGLNIIIYGALKGLGDTRIPLFLAMFCMWGLGLPLSYALAIPLGFGLVGAWLALMIEMAGLGALYHRRFRKLTANPARWPVLV